MILCVLLLFGNIRSASAAYYDSGQDGNTWGSAYVIGSAEDLAALRDRVNSGEEPSRKYYVLGSDIDLTAYTSWIPIGISGNNFKGHFDGQGHTITIESVITEGAGIFCYLYAYGEDSTSIRNLNVAGNLSGESAGGICYSLLHGTIENCSFNGTVSASSVWAGGIAASIAGNSKIAGCTVNADISSTYMSGGIVGHMSGGSVENCTVEDGTKISASSRRSYVGGIAGYSESGILNGNTWPASYPEAGSPDVVIIPEPEDTTSWNGHRYQIFSGDLSWEEAKAHCESQGGHLATITSQAEQDFVNSLLADSQDSYWLGGFADDSGMWHWVTDEPFERQYQNYSEDQPDGSGGYLLILESGLWDDVRSEENTSGFICEWDNEPEQVKAAPLASSFVEWLADPELRADGDGAAPSPVDVSHLRNNPPRLTASSVFAAAGEDLPVSYDARTAIGLPEVRDQGKYNTCWAFAALGALEASYRKQGMNSLGEDPDLSELHLAYFTYRTIYSKDIIAEDSILNQCGDPGKAANFLSAQTAPVKEADMPYTEASNNDSELEAFAAGKTFTRAPVILRETKVLGQIGPENISLIKRAIMENGAVYFQYSHYDSGYDEVNHSLYYTGLKGRHAALLAGWDDEFPAERFRNRPSSNGAWLVRNSRGKDFGDNGYFWVSYEQGINAVMDQCCVFIASEDVMPRTTEIKKNDIGGGGKNITPKWSANIFRAERNESIVSISFQTTDNNAEYEIFINNLGKEKPTDPGSVAAEPELSGVMPYAGYHTLSLPKSVDVYAGDYYSVIVKMTTRYEYPTNAEGSIRGYFTASVVEGRSYFASGDEVPSVWVDGKYLDGEEYNATVRVLTVERVSYETAPVIVTESLASGVVGEEYSAELEARGSGSIEWRAGRLPEGFAFSREGVLSGKSSVAVDEEVRFTAINSVGRAEAVLRLVVSEDVPVPPEPPVPPESQDEPVVPVQTRSSGSGGGGCDSGLWGMFGLAAVVFVGRRR